MPRAIIDYERHSFVAWNSKFLERTGFSEDEMKSSRSDELLTFGDSWFSLAKENEGQSVEYVACVAGALLAPIPRRDLPSDRMAKSATDA